jgi:hypothetical protein
LVTLDQALNELAVFPPDRLASSPLARNLAVTSAAFDATGEWIVAASEGGMLRYYSFVLREEVASSQLQDTPKVLFYSLQGK